MRVHQRSCMTEGSNMYCIIGLVIEAFTIILRNPPQIRSRVRPPGSESRIAFWERSV
jgi:hypothetical protein